jgi:hypothetical protein
MEMEAQSIAISRKLQDAVQYNIKDVTVMIVE